MPDSTHLLLFVAAGLLLNLTPGPDVFCIIEQSLRRGVRAGLAASLGVAAGCCIHIAAAALGVSALVAASATAFAVLKWVGAAYLVYVGVAMLRSRASGIDLPPQADADAPPGVAGTQRAAFLRGFWTNALNPKVALFFLAFVPQFIAPGTPHASLVFLALGLLFNFNALWVSFGWALVAAWTARRVGAVRRGLHGLERAAGLLFIGFGLRLAFTDAPPSAPSAR